MITSSLIVQFVKYIHEAVLCRLLSLVPFTSCMLLMCSCGHLESNTSSAESLLENPKVVTVKGEVRNPKSIEFQDGMVVWDAITEAGGLTDYAGPLTVVRGQEFISISAKERRSFKLVSGDLVLVLR